MIVWQVCSQRRYASSHTRQSYPSRHGARTLGAGPAGLHVRRSKALVRLASYSVWRDRDRPVVTQMSAPTPTWAASSLPPQRRAASPPTHPFPARTATATALAALCLAVLAVTALTAVTRLVGDTTSPATTSATTVGRAFARRGVHPSAFPAAYCPRGATTGGHAHNPPGRHRDVAPSRPRRPRGSRAVVHAAGHKAQGMHTRLAVSRPAEMEAVP